MRLSAIIKAINLILMNEQSMGASRPGLKSVTNLLKDAWAQYSKHFNVLVPIMLLAGIGLYLQSIFLFIGSDGRNMDASFGILALLATLIYLVGMIWGFTAVLNRVSKLDQPMTVKQAFMDAKPYIWPVFLVGLLSGIFTLIGLILLVIPGIIVGVWLSFSYFVAVSENKRGMDALKASKAYVEGYWWPVFGRLLLIGLVVGIAAAIIGGIANMLLGYQVGTLVQNIVSLGLAPLVVLYQYDLYRNVKQVKGGTTPMSSPEPSAPEASPENV